MPKSMSTVEFKDYVQRVRSLIPKDIDIDVDKRDKDSGAFVHFTSTRQGETKAQAYERIKERFKDMTASSKCSLVRGQPFVVDIDSRTPSPLLRVSYKGDVVSEDILRQLQVYGQIKHTIPLEKEFRRKEDAVAARNCLHNNYFPDLKTTLYIDYEKKNLKLIEWFAKYPKLAELEKPCSFKGHVGEDSMPMTDDRKLVELINREPNAVSMVYAPKGAGKSCHILHTLDGRANSIVVNFRREMCTTEEELVEQLGKEIGFHPSFRINSAVIRALETGIPFGSVGQILQPTGNAQLRTLLGIIDRCLARKHKEHSKDPSAPYPVIVLDNFFSTVDSLENPNRARILRDAIIHWAYKTTHRGRAHVIFLSSDPFAHDMIVQYATDRGGESVIINLDYAPPAMAQEYLENSKTKLDKDEIDVAVAVLGGRYTDLKDFTTRVKLGKTPDEAIKEMVDEDIKYIRESGFGFSKKVEMKKTRLQLWESIKLLSTVGYVRYEDLLFNVFGGDESALNGLINKDIFRFHKVNDQTMVAPYSPLRRAAFKTMLKDTEFSVSMDLLSHKASIDWEMSQLAKVEEEIANLTNIKKTDGIDASILQMRISQLSDKMKRHITNINNTEREIKENQDVLLQQRNKSQ
eukprot:gene14776-17465_t